MKLQSISAGLLLGALSLSTAATTITVKGSDTMVIMAQRWAEAYMADNTDVKVQVTGGGSGVGISALINGATDICDASRPMKGSERESLKSRYSSLGVEVKAAKDGLSLYLNDQNPIDGLTTGQIKDIYEGKITNWKQLGGSDAKIVLYGRDNSSGTYVFFRDNVLKGEDYSSSMQSLPGTAAVVNAVAKDKYGIGYGGVAYGKGIKFAKVNGITPSAETVKDGTYPLSRYLYMYLRNRPTGEIKKYVDWILSPAGQAIVVKVGYFPAK